MELQVKFLPMWKCLETEDGVEKLLAHLGVLDGERPGGRDRLSQNRALFDYTVRRGETIADYILGRGSHMSDAEVKGLTLPDNVKARFYEEGAN